MILKIKLLMKAEQKKPSTLKLEKKNRQKLKL